MTLIICMTGIYAALVYILHRTAAALQGYLFNFQTSAPVT